MYDNLAQPGTFSWIPTPLWIPSQTWHLADWILVVWISFAPGSCSPVSCFPGFRFLVAGAHPSALASGRVSLGLQSCSPPPLQHLPETCAQDEHPIHPYSRRWGRFFTSHGGSPSGSLHSCCPPGTSSGMPGQHLGNHARCCAVRQALMWQQHLPSTVGVFEFHSKCPPLPNWQEAEKDPRLFHIKGHKVKFCLLLTRTNHYDNKTYTDSPLQRGTFNSCQSQNEIRAHHFPHHTLQRK